MTILFWTLVALFAVAALAFVLPALLARGGRAESPAGDAANIAIYRDQRRELDSDLAAGTLAREQHDEARRELERRMLEDVGPGMNAAPAVEPGRGTALAVGFAILLVAALLYFAVGSPRALAPVPTGGHKTLAGELRDLNRKEHLRRA